MVLLCEVNFKVQHLCHLIVPKYYRQFVKFNKIGIHVTAPERDSIRPRPLGRPRRDSIQVNSFFFIFIQIYIKYAE